MKVLQILKDLAYQATKLMKVMQVSNGNTNKDGGKFKWNRPYFVAR